MNLPSSPGNYGYGDRADGKLVATPIDPIYRRLSSPATKAVYSYIYPFLLPAVFPSTEIDPVTECFASMGIPSDYRFLTFPYQVFDMGPQGNEMGLPGNAVMCVPQSELEGVLNFVRSIVLFDAQGTNVALRIQELDLVDPSLKKSTFIQPKEASIKVHAIVLESDKTSIYFRRKEWYVDIGVFSYRAVRDDRVYDPKAAALIQSFMAGDRNPLGTVEKTLGEYEFPKVGEQDNRADDSGVD